VRFASLFSGGFTTVAVCNKSTRKETGGKTHLCALIKNDPYQNSKIQVTKIASNKKCAFKIKETKFERFGYFYTLKLSFKNYCDFLIGLFRTIPYVMLNCLRISLSSFKNVLFSKQHSQF
jgi:hypothetical protein